MFTSCASRDTTATAEDGQSKCTARASCEHNAGCLATVLTLPNVKLSDLVAALYKSPMLADPKSTRVHTSSPLPETQTCPDFLPRGNRSWYSLATRLCSAHSFCAGVRFLASFYIRLLVWLDDTFWSQAPSQSRGKRKPSCAKTQCPVVLDARSFRCLPSRKLRCV